ncbi:MAG: hypothetical protein ACOH2E_02390 [Candidatus Paracaedibacter sp.]
MKKVVFTLLFLFCCGNLSAYGVKKDSEDIAKKTKVMMDDIDKILRDFYKNVQENQKTHQNEDKISDGMKYKPYGEPVKIPGETLPGKLSNDFGFYKSHRENMQVHFSLQDRYADLQQQSQELKRLREEWKNNKRDRALYEKYADEQEKYTQALNAYKQDVTKHNQMKRMVK